MTPRRVCGQEIPLLSVPSQKRLPEGGGSGVMLMLSEGLGVMLEVLVLKAGVDLLGCTVDVTSSETVGTSSGSGGPNSRLYRRM